MTPFNRQSTFGNRQSRSAFTLVELLIVVTIIVVLIAILLPSIERATDNAQSAACNSNLHQWALADMTYNSDYFGAYPIYTSTVTPFVRIKTYWQSDDLKFCPRVTNLYNGQPCVGGASFAYYTGTAFTDAVAGSYTYNGMCNLRNAWPNLLGCGNIDINNYISNSRQADSRVPLIGDGAWTAGFAGATYATGDIPEAEEWSPTSAYNASWGLPRWAIRRHLGTSVNLALADGHTETSILPNLWVRYRWHANYLVGQPAPVIPWYTP